MPNKGIAVDNLSSRGPVVRQKSRDRLVTGTTADSSANNKFSRQTDRRESVQRQKQQINNSNFGPPENSNYNYQRSDRENRLR